MNINPFLHFKNNKKAYIKTSLKGIVVYFYPSENFHCVIKSKKKFLKAHQRNKTRRRITESLKQVFNSGIFTVFFLRQLPPSWNECQEITSFIFNELNQKK